MLEKKPKSKFTPPVKKMSEKTISSLESALEYQKIGDYDSASTIFKKILNADPNNSFANHFLGLILFNKGDSNKAIDLMKKYDWSGNVRELRNVIERLIILGDKEISPKNVKDFIKI